jgi:indole-3-glycerol phosphate synthase
MVSKLEEICTRRLSDVALLKEKTPLAVLESRLAGASPVRGFKASLLKPGLRVIAEVKKASPSVGAIQPDADPVAVATGYEAAGAACLSVLTEPHWFQGADADLLAARAAVAIPVLRKDFVVDPWQLAETRVLGADCCLLIVAHLGSRTADYLALARSYGLDVLVEVHDEAELEIALAAGADLIGVNNRNLKTLKIDLATSERLAGLMPKGVTFVAESGLESREDFARMSALGAEAVLVGSALMRTGDPGARLADLTAGL